MDGDVQTVLGCLHPCSTLKTIHARCRLLGLDRPDTNPKSDAFTRSVVISPEELQHLFKDSAALLDLARG